MEKPCLRCAGCCPFCSDTELDSFSPLHLSCFPTHRRFHPLLICMISLFRRHWPDVEKPPFHSQSLRKCQASCYSHYFCISYSCWYHQIKSGDFTGLLWNRIWLSAAPAQILVRWSHTCWKDFSLQVQEMRSQQEQERWNKSKEQDTKSLLNPLTMFLFFMEAHLKQVFSLLPKYTKKSAVRALIMSEASRKVVLLNI